MQLSFNSASIAVVAICLLIAGTVHAQRGRNLEEMLRRIPQMGGSGWGSPSLGTSWTAPGWGSSWGHPQGDEIQSGIPGAAPGADPAEGPGSGALPIAGGADTGPGASEDSGALPIAREPDRSEPSDDSDDLGETEDEFGPDDPTEDGGDPAEEPTEDGSDSVPEDTEAPVTDPGQQQDQGEQQDPLAATSEPAPASSEPAPAPAPPAPAPAPAPPAPAPAPTPTAPDGSLSAPGPSQSQPNTPSSVDASQNPGAGEHCLRKVNEFRSENGKPPLTYNDRLEMVADEHSGDQADSQMITHDGFDQERTLADAENVAFNGGKDEIEGIEKAIEQFKNSPSHREAMLGDYTQMGCSARAEQDLWYTTQLFKK